MSLTVRELRQVVDSLAPLAGGVVQGAYLPEPCSLFLELRKPGRSFLLLLCAETGRTRLHLAARRPPSPATPFAFQGWLRARLVGATLRSIEAPENERLVTLRFLAEEGELALVAELTGRHGNLFVVDAAGVVRASCARNRSTLRDNVVGSPYVPPFAREALPAFETTSRFEGLAADALSSTIEALYGEKDRETLSAASRRERLAPLFAKERKLRRTLEKVAEDETRAARADEHLHLGELLKRNIDRLAPGQREAALIDYTEEGPREILVPLDPARGPQATIDHAFRQYRRLKGGQALARARREQLERELAALLVRIAVIERETETPPDAPRPPGAPLPLPRSPRPRPRLPWREYVSESGQRIRVGRGAEDNDALTFRHSKGNDIWLHVRGGTGSHVVVPLGGEALREATLSDAAALAAHFSELRGRGQIDVAWTQAKHVRKMKGSPGAVTYSQDRTYRVREDSARIAKLLATASES